MRWRSVSTWSGTMVSQAPEQVRSNQAGLCLITGDHGPECQSRALEECASREDVQLDFIRPKKPVSHTFIEALDGRGRDDASLADVPAIMGAWRIDYRPSSLAS